MQRLSAICVFRTFLFIMPSLLPGLSSEEDCLPLSAIVSDDLMFWNIESMSGIHL